MTKKLKFSNDFHEYSIFSDAVSLKTLSIWGRLQLMKRKGIYAYEWMDNFDKYDQTEFPSIERFDNWIIINVVLKIMNVVN